MNNGCILRRHLILDNTTRALAEAHQALQGYLDKEHPGVWQDKVQPKLKVLANPNRTDFAYICEKTERHVLDWTENPERYTFFDAQGAEKDS